MTLSLHLNTSGFSSATLPLIETLLVFFLLRLQDAVRKRRMEQMEQKQREQVGASSCLHFFFFFFFVVVFFAKLFIIQMFLLKAERMKRLEKEKVSVSFILLCDHLCLLLFSSKDYHAGKSDEK